MTWCVGQPQPKRPTSTRRYSLVVLLIGMIIGGRIANGMAGETGPGEGWLSPAALAVSSDGNQLYVACGTASELLILDARTGIIRSTVALPGPGSGLALDEAASHLYVTCPAPAASICEIDLKTDRTRRTLPARHTPVSPVLSRDNKTLYVCERFNQSVSIYDLASGRQTSSINLAREPISAALTLDGARLLVAHHLPSGRADCGLVASGISVIDVGRARRVKELRLPAGSSLAREIKVSPDGRYAAVTHNLGRFQLPTTQPDRGWMNTAALTLLDVREERLIGTVLLDEIERGAANPWGLGWSDNGKWLCISHAGTHELSLIRAPELVAKLNHFAAAAGETDGALSSDLSFLVGIRERVKLAGNGPRALVVADNRVTVADYFSDVIELVDLEPAPLASRRSELALHGPLAASTLRKGEMWFNDATLCFQGWQSCATCHSDDGRIDGLNWDLLNDGVGNPKNSKSLLLAHQTPPAMSTGVRETGETAVRAGIRHILFAVQPENVACALDEWLKSLRPLASPFLENGTRSAAARRGQRLFQSARVGCGGCHPAELFTNLAQYDVGTANDLDAKGQLFDTPTLVELWRTAPYLHDGSAATLQDVLTTHNRADRHGHTSELSPEQVDDLIAYLLTL